MPRIAREEHHRIRERVEAGEKVAAVAASYGCTPANIYAILARLRQAGPGTEAPGRALADRTQPVVPPVEAGPVPELPLVPPEPQAMEALRSTQPVGKPPAGTPAKKQAAPPPLLSHSSSPAPEGTRAGFALMMRTGDGEEAMTPFRSLEELLSAAKPLLRQAARSPDPVWFSIQPVDLDKLEEAL